MPAAETAPDPARPGPRTSRLFAAVAVSGIAVLTVAIASPTARAFALGVGTAMFAAFLLVERVRRADRTLERAEDRIGLLLGGEEGPADWLWETDADGRIVNPCARFAEAARLPPAGLEGRPLTSLFAASSARDLERALMSARTFQDLVLELASPGDPRWWSLSGRPRASGGFDGVASDMTATRDTAEQVHYFSQYDALTHLPNRGAMIAALDAAFAQSRENGTSFALLCLDIDNFKSVNDTIGHAAGDAFLRLVAGRLRDCVGEDTLLARLHGDDFAVLQLHASREDADRLADLLVDALLAPVLLQGRTVMVGGSIGIAMGPEDAADAGELLRNAELALYQAKDHGRGCARFFEPGMDAAARAQAELETDLRRALANDSMDVWFQPIVDAADERIVGYETLLRWHRPGRGLVTPTEFIACAEETGVIVPLGEWVIRRAVEEAARWRDRSLTVSVNLSSAQFRNPAIVSTVVQALARHQIEPSRLEIEITESLLMRETAHNLRTLQALRSLGVRVVLDDFGTGYSSLNYLRAFPFDKLKIDQCFVRSIDGGKEASAIIRAVISLGRDLGMQVLAEGVERRDQADALKALGCQQFQGFLYGRAIPAASIDRDEEADAAIASAEGLSFSRVRRMAEGRA